MISPAEYKEGKQPPKKPKKKSALKAVFKWAFIALILLSALGAGLAVGGWFWISRDLPSIETLNNYNPPAVTQVFSRDGKLMAEFMRQRRYLVNLEELPAHVGQAFVAAEDGDFYHHEGVDIPGIIRAALANFRAGRVVQGGSTITQQVAKALLLTPRRTYIRKFKEMILAWRMEKYLTKDQILNIYINHIYLGHGAYGVEAAARTYFNKHAEQLSVAESALIAGLIQAPSRYSPVREPKRARNRQLYVIDRMLAEGFITSEHAEQARTEQLEVSIHHEVAVDAPYYTESVRRWLMDRFGADALYDGGLRVETPCDARLTAAAQQSIAAGLADLTKRQGFAGPLGHLDEVALAEVASRPYSASELPAGSEVAAVVVSLDPKGQYARLRFGRDRGVLHLEDVKWAHKRPTSLSDKPEAVTEIGHVVQVGDKVMVRMVEQEDIGGWWKLELLQEPFAQAALLAMDPHNGRVQVIIGGRDYEISEYNRALQAHRQPGSAFKPFIYAAALDKEDGSYTAVTTILDAPVVYDEPDLPGEKWKPKNYENRFFGPTTLRHALEHSRNVVTVKLLDELGLKDVVDFTRRLGITSPMQINLSLALGTSGLTLLELTRAYCAFDNGGYLVQPVMIERVLDRHGKVLYESQPAPEQVISPQTAFLITHLLRGVMEQGTGRGVRVPGAIMAGKTGTTNDLRDAWFVGFTPQLACGVWVGQDDNLPLGRRETGARAAGPIWRMFMTEAVKGEKPTDFPVPEGVVFVRVDRETGKPLPAGSDGGFFEAFKAGTEPKPEEAAVKKPENNASEFLQGETFAK